MVDCPENSKIESRFREIPAQVEPDDSQRFTGNDYLGSLDVCDLQLEL